MTAVVGRLYGQEGEMDTPMQLLKRGCAYSLSSSLGNRVH